MSAIDNTHPARIWRLPIAQIEKVVSAQLGPGRVRGNEHGPCFSRQISMYLARHVAGWSTTKIGRFYNGRHHTTVLHAIVKIERLRKEDEAIDALLEVLTGTLAQEVEARPSSEATKPNWRDSLVERIANHILSGFEAVWAKRQPHRQLTWENQTMQTIVNLPDPLFQKSVAIAASRGETVEQLILEAIAREVDAHDPSDTYGNAEVKFPVLVSRCPGTLDLVEFDFDDLLA